MRINNFYDTNKPQQSPNQNKSTFKGYFACPIKELHIQTFHPTKCANRYPIIKEMEKKCGQYFRILVQTLEGFTDASKFQKQTRLPSCNYYEFGQDNKLFTQNQMLLLQACRHWGWQDAETLAKHLNMPTREISGTLEGGNCFLGKKPNGDSFALIGSDGIWEAGDTPYFCEITNTAKTFVAKELGLSLDNVHVIHQPDFHLDFAIRPLNYPYVLVDDRALTQKLVAKKTGQAIDVYGQHKDYILHREYLYPEEVVKELEAQNFKPVLVPGSLGDKRQSVNYMNAIVHQTPDGRLVYITNRSKNSRLTEKVDLEDIFTQHLREKCPQISDIIFIDGDGEIEKCLRKESAGVHCLFSENPNFERWATT